MSRSTVLPEDSAPNWRGFFSAPFDFRLGAYLICEIPGIDMAEDACPWHMHEGMTLKEPPRLPPKGQSFHEQAHSLKGERGSIRDGVKLTLSPSDLSGQELGRGLMELPLAASRPAKRR